MLYRDSPGLSPTSDSREIVRHELEESALAVAMLTRQPTAGNAHGVVFHRVVARLVFSGGQSVGGWELIKTGLSKIGAPTPNRTRVFVRSPSVEDEHMKPTLVRMYG